jgi:hypothetical protein
METYEHSRQTSKYIMIVLSLLAAGAIGFIAASGREEGLTTQVVRTYQTSPEFADELKSRLNHLLWTKDNGDGGSAQVFGNGLVLVRATIGHQQGVAHLIEKLSSQPTPPRKRVRLDYYILLSQQANKATAADSDLLAELAPVVSTIEKMEGPRRVRLLEHIVSLSLTGEKSLAEGAMLKTSSVTSIAQGQPLLNVSLDSWFGKINTHIDLQPGEMLILGQSAQKFDDTRTKVFGDGNIYYVVRAEIQK